ncbi:MAG: DJ-1/PfpI family protein [Bacteroidales bacterium]
MNKKLLTGKKIAVLLEAEFIPSEINYYAEFFSALGAEIYLMSHLRGQKEKTFVSDIHGPDCKFKDIKTITIKTDVHFEIPSKYDAILVASHHCSARLREIHMPDSPFENTNVKVSTAVHFFGEAMKNNQIVKGALGHALWILTPRKELLEKRKVTCNSIILADVLNAGGNYVDDNVVTDNDLVTGKSIEYIKEYCYAISQTIIRKQKEIEKIENITMSN